MASKPTHDLSIKIGEYPDRHSGELKARWLKVGTLFRHDDGGLAIKLDCIPLGVPEWNGWINVFKREEHAPRAAGHGARQAPPQAAPAAYGGPVEFDDDIPF